MTISKINLWKELTRLNGKYAHHSNNYVYWQNLMNESIRICYICGGYNPCGCDTCHTYVRDISMKAPNIISLREYLMSIKNFYINKRINCDLFTEADYDND